MIVSRDQTVPSQSRKQSVESEPIQQTSTSPSSTSGSERAKTSSVDGNIPALNIPSAISPLPAQKTLPTSLPGLLPSLATPQKDLSVETLLYLRQLVQPSLNPAITNPLGLGGLNPIGINMGGLTSPLLNPSFNMFQSPLPSVGAFPPSNLYSLYSDATALYLKSRETIAQLARQTSIQK